MWPWLGFILDNANAYKTTSSYTKKNSVVTSCTFSSASPLFLRKKERKETDKVVSCSRNKSQAAFASERMTRKKYKQRSRMLWPDRRKLKGMHYLLPYNFYYYCIRKPLFISVSFSNKALFSKQRLPYTT